MHLLSRKSELAFFLGNVNLQQTFDHPIVFFRLFVNFLQDFQTIHRVNQRHKGRDVFHLIGLQMADHVPRNVLGKLFVFFGHFLRLVLAKQLTACFIGFLQHSYGLGFGYGYKVGHRPDFLGYLGNGILNCHGILGFNKLYMRYLI